MGEGAENGGTGALVWPERYDLVIGTDLSNDVVLHCLKKCAEVPAGRAPIPFVLLRQWGLIASIRVDVAEQCVAEKKEYQVVEQDLRLNAPFPTLVEATGSGKYDLPSLALEFHSHVPHVVLLLQAAAAWRDSHDGAMPKTRAEKEEFKQTIKAMALDFSKELNFAEALKNAHLLYQSPGLPADVEDIFAHPKVDEANEKGEFWLLSAALKQFHAEFQTLPVAGTVPDMTAHTTYYLELQRVYQEKAAEDVEQFKGHLAKVLESRGIEPAEWIESHAAAIKTFCKNSRNLQVTRVSSLEAELNEFAPPEDFQWELHDPESCSMWYVVARCIEDFRQEKGHYAGLIDHDSEELTEEEKQQAAEEYAWLKARLDAYVAKVTPDQQADERYLKEMVRFADSKIHTVSAFLGGVASQEIIKILIKQYTIMHSTLIYDGIHGRCQVIQFD